MNNLDRAYNFVFRGLLADEALDSAGRAPPSLTSELDAALEEKLSLLTLAERHAVAAKRMAVVYVAIAAFENMARDLIEKVLADAYKEEWWAKGASDKIRKRAEERKLEEEKFRWHTPRGEHPIHYTDLGDLANIVRQQIAIFEPHVRSAEWVDSIFDVLERSRNVIMHSGQLADRDVERVGINIRDWIAQVGA